MKHLEKFNLFTKKLIAPKKEILYILEDKSKITVYGFDEPNDLRKFLIKGDLGSIIYVGKSNEISNGEFLDIIKPIKKRILDLESNNLVDLINVMGNPNYVIVALK